MLQVQIDATTVGLKGDVSMQNLNPSLLAQVIKGCQQSHIDTLDLAGVGQADSACVGLLLAVIKARQQAGLPAINVCHLPDSVRALSTLYELDSVITAS
ncbi:MAG: STAS domain-containing protein [Neisseriaceae bacterium]|nr:STAS domain-containing protein [Neisseriaceae bacterium]MBP6862533.1 STAS domain-containing protein [Neisseriaceae bacterium]